MLSAFAPVSMRIFCFLKTRSNSLEMSSSSTGTTRGSISIMVTSVPKRLKMDANSTPTARSEEHTSELQSHSDLVVLHTFPTRRSSDLEGHALSGLLNVVGLRAGLDADLLLLEDALQLLGDVFILHGHDARQHLNNGDIGAEAFEDGRELHAHREIGRAHV